MQLNTKYINNKMYSLQTTKVIKNYTNTSSCFPLRQPIFRTNRKLYWFYYNVSINNFYQNLAPIEKWQKNFCPILDIVAVPIEEIILQFQSVYHFYSEKPRKKRAGKTDKFLRYCDINFLIFRIR